jgi:hypothetical protein
MDGQFLEGHKETFNQEFQVRAGCFGSARWRLDTMSDHDIRCVFGCFCHDRD